MTTKTEIILPEIPADIVMVDRAGMRNYARAAVEADRQNRMPSDAELLKWAGEEQFFLFCDEDEFLQIAREVLSRYSSQPTPDHWQSVAELLHARGYVQSAGDIGRVARLLGSVRPEAQQGGQS